MNGIYRIEPKEEDSSMKRLDKMITVTSPSLWLILLGGVIIVAAVLVWSCTGRMTETVDATGLYHPSASEYGEVIAMLPLGSGKRISPGMEVTLYAAGYNQQEYGHMKAVVTYVDDYVTTVDEMQKLLQSDSLVSAYAQGGPVMAVICRLQEDPKTKSGYYWSSSRGKKVALYDGTFMSMSITVSRIRPITLGVPALEEYFGDL